MMQRSQNTGLFPRCFLGRWLITLAFLSPTASKALVAPLPLLPQDQAARMETRLHQSLRELDAALTDPAKRQAWFNYLDIPSLQTELAQPAPSEAKLTLILQRFHQADPSLAWAPVAAVRSALSSWLAVRCATDVPSLIALSEQAYRPIFPREAKEAEQDLRRRLKSWLAPASDPQAILKTPREISDPGYRALIPALQSSLATPDLEHLTQLLQSLEASAWLYGNDRPVEARELWFALHRTIRKKTAVLNQKDDKARFMAAVQHLGQALQALQADSSSLAGLGLEDDLDFLRASDRAEALIAAVDYLYRHHNLSLDVSDTIYRGLMGKNAKLFPAPSLEQFHSPSLSISSLASSQFMTVAALQASPFQLAAPTAPDAPAATGDLVLTLHQSAFNNLFHHYRSQFTEAGLIQKNGKDALVHGFDALFTPTMPALDQQDSKQQILLLGPSYPLTIRFEAQQAEMRLRVDDIITIAHHYKARDIYITYSLRNDQEDMVLEQTRPIEVYPQGSRSEAELSFADKLVQGAVRQELKKFLKPNLTLPKNFGSMALFDGKDLTLSALSMDKGWLTVAFAVAAAAPSSPVQGRPSAAGRGKP